MEVETGFISQPTLKNHYIDLSLGLSGKACPLAIPSEAKKGWNGYVCHGLVIPNLVTLEFSTLP